PSRRPSTGPNGVTSSAQFAGSALKLAPPPCPPPPAGEGDVAPVEEDGVEKPRGRAAIAAIRARRAVRSAVTGPRPARPPARGGAWRRPSPAPRPRAPGQRRTDSHSRRHTG